MLLHTSLMACCLLFFGSAHAADATSPSPESRDRATKGIRQALVKALQADGRAAIAELRLLDPKGLDSGSRDIRDCMLNRLEARSVPPATIDEPFLVALRAAYADYWLDSLHAPHRAPANEADLVAALNSAVKRAGGDSAGGIDELEPAIERLVRARGYHVLLGVTSPLREFMLWENQNEQTFDVELPEGTEHVVVVFMTDFASLGWAGFVTCDRHHTGGWTRPDRLYAVRDAYDVESEAFRVSYLAHEGQHFADNRRFPKLVAQHELEYRAKLVELALGDATVRSLLDHFMQDISNDTALPHSHANGQIVHKLGQRLGPGKSPTDTLRTIDIGTIKSTALALLFEDSAARRPAPSGERGHSTH